LGHAAYDCFYLAHAEQLRAPFLTADRKLIEKVRASTATEVEMLTLQDYARENGL
jgi:predicted nucleic acid-binding protein